MTGPFVTPEELHQRLVNHGHPVRSHGNSPTVVTDVRPLAETVVTVAVEPDGTLKPAYRERYFACRCDATDFPVAPNEPKLALPETLARVAGEESTQSCFLAGPVRWLVSRLARFPRLLLWPDGEYRSSDGNGLVHPELVSELPRLRARLDNVGPIGQPIGALVLHLDWHEDAAVFWEVATLVGGSHENFYVADVGATQVYLMHHHDKVVASVPDQHIRRLMLEELASLSHSFEDWSATTRPWMMSANERTTNPM